MRNLSHYPKPQESRLPRPLPRRPVPHPHSCLRPSTSAHQLVTASSTTPMPGLATSQPEMSGFGARAQEPVSLSPVQLATTPCPTLPALSTCRTRPVSGLLGPGENFLPFLTLGDLGLQAVGACAAGPGACCHFNYEAPCGFQALSEAIARRPVTCCGFSRSPARLESTVWLWGFVKLTTCLSVLHGL